MKKLLGIVLAFVMLVTILAIIPAASDVAQEDGYYVYLDEGITLVHVSGGTEYRMPIAAKDLAKFPKLQDGQTTSEYSVKTYLTALMEDGQPKFLEDLMIALLNYGAAAQEYFGEAGALVGTPVTDTAALVAATAPEVNISDDSGIYIGATLILEGTIKLRFYFRGTDITANVGTVTNPEGANYSYVDVAVMPYAMADSVTVTVGTTSVTYAPLNYLKNKVADPELSTMVASIYAYGAAAKAYVDHVHDFSGEGAITLPATCTTAGVKTYTCPCGDSYTEPVAALGHRYGSGVTTVQATCAPGNKKFTCTRQGCGHVKNEAIAPVKDHTVDDIELIITVEPTVAADGERTAFCDACNGWATYTYTYNEYKALLNAEKSELDKITISGTTSIDSSPYSAPKTYPKEGVHPRLLVTADVIDEIRTALVREDTRDEMISILRDVCFKANDYASGADLGTATNPTYPASWPSGTHNYLEDLLNSITSKAFLYLYTGTEYYAVEALRYIMQYMETMDMKSDVGDPERYYGHVMFTAALVYDWCYDAMTDADREELVKCIKNVASGTHDGEGNMEIGFPPEGQGAVCGHGSERQILRDYLAVALAIYDEYPDWYDYIGGRFFQDYVPVREEFYKSGMYPQGISVYIAIRFTSDLWSAWLMQTATGSNPYEGMGQDQIIRSVFSRVVDGSFYFLEEGDDQEEVNKWGQNRLKQYALAAYISSYLYDDPTAAAWANGDWIESSSARANWKAVNGAPIFQLLLRSTGVDNTGDRHEGLDLICYNGGFLNEIVAHDGWGADDVSVLMKIGGRTTANHDHADAGSFQIYYKGVLAGDTGFYDTYNHNSDSHFKTYHQATVAHNSILIYEEKTSWGRKTINSYGQKAGSTYAEPKNLSTWLSSTYKTADLLGVSYKYDTKGNPKYAYIAGDITPAYHAVSTTYARSVQRRMLSVFNTQNTDVPMYFFVYDRVEIGSSNYQVAFLLHTVNEPTIEGNTVTAISGGNATNGKPKSGGKLVLQSVIGDCTIEKIGGENMNYVVNGSQVATGDGEDDGFWGRVEIKTKKNTGTNQTLLNVMYVTDANKTLTLPATSFSTDKVDGAAIGNTVAVFLKNTTSNTDTITFTAPDTDFGTKVFYYVSGMADGKWTITCGTQTINVTVDEDDGGLLVFNTYAGKEVTITPTTEASGPSSENELPVDGTK